MTALVAQGAVCPLLACGQFTPRECFKKDEGNRNA